jgi:SAM-dependent methyltransferase
MDPKPSGFHRLQLLRMENAATGYQMEEERGRFDRLRDRHTNGAAPVAIAAPQLFQTPPDLAARLADALAPAPGSRILEPSAGLGRLLDALTPYQPAEVVAVEIAAACAGELFRQEREGVTIRQRDFLATTPAELGTFDAVAMNPPFTMRSDLRHIRHALEFLRPGGRLAALCMDTPHRSAALEHIADTWQRIPAGAFRGEGTNVPTILLTITKK